jgi:hypothetical protein
MRSDIDGTIQSRLPGAGARQVQKQEIYLPSPAHNALSHTPMVLQDATMCLERVNSWVHLHQPPQSEPLS